MKVFTATGHTQGAYPGDYHFCVEGELVMPPPFICDRDAADPDGGCGCGRGWAGLSTHRATTSAVVSVIDGIDLDDYAEAIASSLEYQGWDRDDAAETAERLATIAASYPVGVVVGHRLCDLYIRSIPPTRIASDTQHTGETR